MIRMAKYLKLGLKNSSLLFMKNFASQELSVNYFYIRRITIFTESKNNLLCKNVDSNTIYIRNLCSKSASKKFQTLKDIITSDNFSNIDLDKNDDIVKILNFLLSKGYSSNEIKEKCLQHLSFANTSYNKFKTLAELDSDVLSLMPFMSLSDSALRKAVQQAREDKYEIKGFINRIAYLCYQLEISLEDTIILLTKHSSLLTMKFNRLSKKIIILKGAEITAEDLVKDPWIFNYNEQLLSKRITAAEEAGVKLKPWMLRCSETFFYSMLKKYSETQRILGGDSFEGYLAKKLNCSEDYVKLMMRKNILLEKVNIPKIDKLIDFLLNKGYTLQEIRLFPKVFSAKIKTLNERLELFKSYHSILPTLSELCVSSNKLQQMLAKKKKIHIT